MIIGNLRNIVAFIAALALVALSSSIYSTMNTNFDFSDYRNSESFYAAVEQICARDGINIEDTDRIFREIGGAERSLPRIGHQKSDGDASQHESFGIVTYAYPSFSAETREYTISVVFDSDSKVLDCSAASHGEPGKDLSQYYNLLGE